MLNFNSEDNLQLNLRSSNAIRGYLKNRPQHRKALMEHLKKTRDETGELPYKKYPGGVKEILTELFGKEFEEDYKKYTVSNSYKFG